MHLGRHSTGSAQGTSTDMLFQEVCILVEEHGCAKTESVIGIIERLNELRSRKFTDPKFVVMRLEDLSAKQRTINPTLDDYLLETSGDIRHNHPESWIPITPA